MGGNLESIRDGNGKYLSEQTDADHIGIVNPIRYRGYYYDTETKLYYLQSRYYNPEICRFINMDAVLPDAGGSLLGYNLYAYCENNPVTSFDPNGFCPYRFDGNFGHYNPNCPDILKDGLMSATPQRPHLVKASSDSDVPYNGKPGSHATSPNGKKERVFGPNTEPDRDRHHTDHGNSKDHSDVPHDHDWGFNEKGIWEPGPAYPSPKGPLTPRTPNDFSAGDDVATAVGSGIVIYATYVTAKWIIAGALAAPTGGASLGTAALTP